MSILPLASYSSQSRGYDYYAGKKAAHRLNGPKPF